MSTRRYRNGSITIIKGKRGKTFEAYAYSDGKRHRKRFPKEGQARAFIEAHESLQDSNLPQLCHADMIDASRALDMLPEGVTLSEAARHYLSTQDKITPVQVSDAIDQFLEAKAKAGRAVRTLQSYRTNLDKLKTINKPVHEITSKDLDSTFTADFENTTIANLLKDYRVFLRWCRRQGYCVEIVTERMEKPSIDQSLAEIFTVQQCALLLYATDQLFPYILPEFAIGLFAGIRPHELERMRWESIGNDRIHVLKSKTRQIRFVEISPNLKEWLKGKHGKKDDRICKGQKLHRQNNKMIVRRLIGLNRWPSDVLRHTFASNHLQHHQNAAMTSLQLGHSGRDVLFDHYRNILEPDQAKTFWELTPENVSKFFPGKYLEKIEKAREKLKKKDL